MQPVDNKIMPYDFKCNPFDGLPKDVIYPIFSMLDMKDLLRLALVSHVCENLSSQDIVWQRHYYDNLCWSTQNVNDIFKNKIKQHMQNTIDLALQNKDLKYA